jgi:hypothetical protein
VLEFTGNKPEIGHEWDQCPRLRREDDNGPDADLSHNGSAPTRSLLTTGTRYPPKPPCPAPPRHPLPRPGEATHPGPALQKEYNDMSDDREAARALAHPTEQADDWLDALIERWWGDHFPGSAVARDTAAWNAAHAAKEALKGLLVRAQSLRQAPAGDNDLQGSI